MSRLFLVSIMLWMASAEAGLQEDFEALRDSAKDYQIVGTVCEEVARLEMVRADYPQPRYRVVTGIAYGNGHRTIGELDVVVFEQRETEATIE